MIRKKHDHQKYKTTTIFRNKTPRIFSLFVDFLFTDKIKKKASKKVQKCGQKVKKMSYIEFLVMKSLIRLNTCYITKIHKPFFKYLFLLLIL